MITTAPVPPAAFIPSPDAVQHHQSTIPAQPQAPLLSSIFSQGLDDRGDLSFSGATVWAANAALGEPAGYASIDAAKAAAAQLSSGAAGAIAVTPSGDGFALHAALVGAYQDSYLQTGRTDAGWRWVTGVKDQLHALHLDPTTSSGINDVKLLPSAGVRPGDALLAYRQHAAGGVLLIDGDRQATFSAEFGLQVR